MPGTILLDDLRSSIGDELRSHAQGLLQLGQGAVQSINDAIPPPPPVPQGPDPNQILQELQQHAQQAAAAAQPAVQVLGGAQQSAGDVLQQLQQHASNLTSDVGQQLQNHVASLTQGAQDAVQSLATPPPPAPPQTTPSVGGPPPSDTTAGGPMGAIDSTTAKSFAQTFGPYAQYAAQKLGIDPSWVAAMAASESNYGKAGGNELFGIKALPGEPGTSMMTHEGEGGGTNMAQTFATYASPLDAVNAYVNLLKNHYPGALNAPTLNDFVHGLKVGGYFTAGEGEYRDILQSISSRPDVQAGLQTAQNVVGGAASALGGAARGALDTASTAMNQSQFNDPQLTADEAYAACGPAAAVRFAERFGRNPTLREATDLAKQVGWTSGGGMAGITSEQRLLKNMGVDTHIVAPDWDAIAKEATTGNPVTISTPGHYFFADGYNPQTGAFHVGRSGLDLVHGAEWMTPSQMESLMGRAQGALFADNPAVPASSTAPASLGGGTTGASNAPITIGGPAPVKAPLYVKGAMQDANGNVVADQGPTPIQTAQDVLGGAAGAVGEAVGGAASALGSAAQGALAQATAPVQLQPGQVSARDQVGQVAADVQQAAQGVLGAAQDVNRLTPGTSAVNAVAPVLGAAASDLGTTARGVVDAAAPVLGGALQDENAQALAFAQSPIGQRLLQAAMENAQDGPSLIPAGTMSLYRDVMQVKNDWLEQNNPLNNLPGARPEPGHEGDITPGGLIAGLTTGIAQQFTDPLMLALLGPTSGVAEAGTGALSGAVSRIVGPQLAERLSPGAVSVLGTIAQKFSQGAIVGGLQNAMFEAEKKTSTPESVGQALVVGAGLGGVIDVGAAGVAQVVRRLGQVLLDNAPQISEALRSRQPAQADVNSALGGVPEMIARARGEAGPAAEQAGAAERPTANPYELPRSAPEPSAAPLSTEEVLSHLEQLDQRHTQNDARIAELQNQISAGGAGDTPADRAELVRLQADQAQIDAAHTSIWDHAGSGGDVYARPASEAGVPLQGGLDAGAAQAPRSLAPETAPPAGARGETAAFLPGAPGAAESAARAESAQPELTGFRAPSSEVAPPIPSTVRGGETGAPRQYQTGDTVSVKLPDRVAERGGTVMSANEHGAMVRTEDDEIHMVRNRDITLTGAATAEPTRQPVRGVEPGAPRAAGVRQRVSPSGEVLSQTTGQPVAPAASELAGNIRLPKFVQQPVADIIQQVHDADPARFEAARRGVVTDQMVRDLAEEAGTTVNRVAAAWKPGKAANAETTLALRTALADRALRVRSAQNLLRLNPASIDARNTLVEALNQHAALQEVVAGVTGEAGRVVRQFRQPVTGEQASLSALQRMAKNARMSPEELAGHLTNVDLSDPQAVASLASTLTTHSFADRAQALWYFNLLSSPVTWMKNGISNALVLASRPIESLAAAGIDAGRAGLTGTDRQRFMGEAPAEIFGMAHGLGPGLQDAFRAMRTGITRRELENPELAGRMEPFSGRLADLTVNVPGRVLSATDALFRTMNEQASIYKLAYRQAAQEGTSVSGMTDRIAEILRNPDQRLLDEAKAEGAYRIFQNPNAVGKAALQVREALPFGTGRFLMPFVNTPVNVGAYALERSPLAAAKLVGSAAERSGGQLSDNIARMTLGTALAGFAALQGAQGNITGAAPTDPTERDAWEREGKQPYSIHAPNGVWYSYGALQPFSTLIAAGAAAGDAWKKGQNDPTTGLNPASLIAITGAAAGRAIIDQPWLQGLAGLVDMLTSSSQPGQPSDPMKQISVNAQRALASGVVPAGVRLLARAFDPTTRTSDPGFEGFGQALAAGIPGLTDKAPARLGAFGQPIQRPGGSGPSVLNPFTPSPETNDPVEKELRRLQDGGYDVEPSLAGKRVTLIGEAIGLTPDQQRQYQTLSGVMTHDLLGSLLATDAYKSLPSDKQALVINRLGDRVADAARKTLYPTLLDQAVAKKVAELQSRQQNTRPGLAPEEFVTRRATGSADAPTGAAPTGSANITVNQEAAA